MGVGPRCHILVTVQPFILVRWSRRFRSLRAFDKFSAFSERCDGPRGAKDTWGCAETHRPERKKERRPLIVWFSSEITGSSAQFSPTFLITDQSRRPSTYSYSDKNSITIHSHPLSPVTFKRAMNQAVGARTGFFMLAHTQAHEGPCTLTSLSVPHWET